MLSTTKGIVLHSIPYADNRVILKIYTESGGMESFMVPVSRSGKGKIRSSILQPLTLVEVVAERRDKKEIHFVKELSCYAPYIHLHEDIIKTSIALFIAEIIYRSVKEEESAPRLFAFITNSIQLLDLKEEGVANFHLVFLLTFTRHLGFYPQNEPGGNNSFFDLKDGVFRISPPLHPAYLDQNDSLMISELMKFSFDNMQDLKLNGELRSRIVNRLLQYYELHLPSMQKVMSHQVLEAVLN